MMDTMIVFLFFIFTSSLVYNSVASAQKLTQEPQEEYFRPSFRSGHNATLLLSGEYTTWKVSQNAGNAINQEAISAIQQTKLVPALFFRYSYHFNIISSFGFFIGSTAGFIASNGSYGNFYPGYGISFPTVTLGLVQNVEDFFRLLIGGEYGAIWYPNMTIKTDSGTTNSLAAVPNIFSVYLGSDFFLERHTAISTQIGGRYFYVPCLNSCSNSNYVNSLSIQGQSIYAQAGLTWLFN